MESAGIYVLWTLMVIGILAFLYIIIMNTKPKDKFRLQMMLYSIVSSLGFIILPLVYIFKKIGSALLYIIPFHRSAILSEKLGMDMLGNDAWRPKNLFTTLVILFVFAFAGVVLHMFVLNPYDINTKKMFGDWGAPVAFSMLAIIVLYTFYLFYKGKTDKMNPENVFPSDKTFREQASWSLKRSGTFMKSLIILTVVLGILIGMLYMAMKSPEYGEWIASSLMIMTGLIVLTLTYFAIKDTKVIQGIMKIKILQLLFHLVFLIPCVIIEIVNYIYQEIKHTPQTIYNILIAEIVFVVLYFILPIIQKKLYTFTPFQEDNMVALVKERDMLYEKEISIKREIRNQHKRYQIYPQLKVAGFIEKIQKDNLTLKQNEVEFDNHIITYICTKCNLPSSDPNKIDRDNYKRTQGRVILEDIKRILKGTNLNDPSYNRIDDGVIRKLATLESQLAEVRTSWKALNDMIKNGEGGLVTKVVKMNPTILGVRQKYADYKDLRAGGKLVANDVRYNYGLSCWFFLHSNSPNFYKDKYYSIINYSNKPNVMYNPIKNKLKIKVQTNTNANREFEFNNIKLQKWNNLVINYGNGVLDIFMDTKMIGSFPQVIPYNSSDNLTVGDGDDLNKGLNGGICNVVFYGNIIRKKRMDFNYEYLKNKNPPTL
tara:strand:- start:27778 stop:29742 length:1965 start_codon:yes stop_codon:yes gene_type:complete